MRNNRISPRRLRLIISTVVFVAIGAIYLIADPDNLVSDFQNLFKIAVALVLAVGVAQPIVGITNAILNFYGKQNDIPSDLRNKILENQHRLWIAGILKGSIENDPLIVPYNEIWNIKFGEENKVNKFQAESDMTFKKKIQERISHRLAREGRPRQKSESLAEGYKTVVDAYIASSGQLVILGEGGSGKTIALLQLLEYLYNEAKQDSKKYMPVVFNLGSWEEKQINLTNWLVSEILETFKDEVSEGLSRVFKYQVRRQQLIFLFDGLDEISKSGRDAFYKELLEFSKQIKRHSIQFVICSRPEEYGQTQIDVETQLVDTDGQLNPKIILLRPIDDEAITQFLAGDDYEQIREVIFGMDDKAIQKFLSARTAEQTRKSIRKKHKLYEPAHHPFILNALAVGYKNPPEKDIAKLETALMETAHMLEADGLHPIPDVVLERYVSQRFDNAEGGAYETYNEETTNDYLSWIAQKLYDTAEGKIKDGDKVSKTEISIENLQPSWLDNDNWRLAYSLVSRILGAVAITIGVGFFLASPLDYLLPGMLAGVVVGVLDYATSLTAVKNLSSRIGAGWFRVIRFLVVLLLCWITLSILLGLITASPPADKIFLGRIAIALSGITLAWFLSIFIAVIYISREIRLKLGDIEPAELIKFEIGTMLRYGLIGGISIGVFVAVSAQILLTIQDSSTALWLTGFVNALNIGWIGGGAVIGFVAGAFFGGLFSGVFGLLSVSSFEIERTRPNQGIRKSVLNALRVGMSLTVVFSGIFFIPLWFTYQESDVVFRAIRNGLTIGVLGGLWSGGISTIHHIVLRFFLFVSGRTPWNISHFLRYCSQIHIMREIGASYAFGHNYVRLYYYKDEVSPARPRWLFALGVLVIFFTVAFGLGSLRKSFNKAIYSFNDPNEYVIGGSESLKNVCVQENQKVVIQSRGVIRTGDYVGYVTPEGTELGMFGLEVGDNFNLEYARDLPNNALICKLDTEDKWRACAERPKDDNDNEIVFPMPWEIRKASFTVSKYGCLQFDINELESEKRKGDFFVVVTIESSDQP